MPKKVAMMIGLTAIARIVWPTTRCAAVRLPVTSSRMVTMPNRMTSMVMIRSAGTAPCSPNSQSSSGSPSSTPLANAEPKP